eukprot:8542561-Pyramimonas_sp.AAC.1
MDACRRQFRHGLVQRHDGPHLALVNWDGLAPFEDSADGISHVGQLVLDGLLVHRLQRRGLAAIDHCGAALGLAIASPTSFADRLAMGA